MCDDAEPSESTMHNLLIFNNFIRNVSNLGIHLYITRKHVA